MASQIHAGLDGMARKLMLGPSSDSPYGRNQRTAEGLPHNLEEALESLSANACFRAAFGDAFVDYYIAIRRFEIARAEKDGGAASADVTAWEHREYFDLA
jgi:glutamine synthetase